MTPERQAKFERTVRRRQLDLTVILENVHDPHNIGAVLRSCDSVGIQEVFVLYTEPHLGEGHLELGKRTSAGTRKWVDVRLYTDAASCFAAVARRYDRVLATHLTTSATDLYALDLTGSVALLFGNERDGVSAEALQYADGNFHIPQMGMSESLNISVACAVTLYEAYRQRATLGHYDQHQLNEPERQALLDDFLQRHENRDKRARVRPEGGE